MKYFRLCRLAVLGAVLLGMLPAAARETVTIPRARFEELERKEKELERLKSELSAAKGETVRLKQEKDEAVARAAAIAATAAVEPTITHEAPPMNTLPPLGKGETVDALDLGAHYRADAAAANTRYRGKVFKVKGQIVGFDKPLLSQDFHVALRTPDRQMRVLCVVTPAAKYVGTFTARGGTELMGALTGGTRVPIAKLGDVILVEGRCRGLDGQIVELRGCSLLSVE